MKNIQELKKAPRRWLVTGVAGFIGSHLLQSLLQLDQEVVGLDNFSTGKQENLDDVQQSVTPQQWSRFQMIRGDIRDLEVCQRAVRGVDNVLHQAALGSVPRSVDDPVASNAHNVTGTLNLMWAAQQQDIRSFVYASSSAVYGDHPGLPKQEDALGRSLSPYAVTKLVNEQYADVFFKSYGFASVGLRYFNVFGPRQDPEGAYAAVIPRWFAAMLGDQPVHIYGDGETSRDFCYVQNVVQANLLAALAGQDGQADVYNIAAGHRTSLNQLFQLINQTLTEHGHRYDRQPQYGDFRVGDVRHSHADIDRAIKRLGYQPTHDVKQGLAETLAWYESRRCSADSTKAPAV